MHGFVSLNSQISPATDAKISAISSAALYGRGVFTTLAVFDSKPFLWEKHWRRLNEHSKTLGMSLENFSEEHVVASLGALLKKNKVIDGKCRITFFDETPSRIWNQDHEKAPSVLMQTSDFRQIPSNSSVNISPYRINSSSPITGVKSCNYLENILAFETAANSGFDEAIRLNERGEVVSFCMANIFWTEANGGKLFTPSLKTGCMAGTTRELIIERYEVVEVEKDVEGFLRDAEKVFISSAGIGVVQISDIAERRLNSEDHELTSLIENELARNL